YLSFIADLFQCLFDTLPIDIAGAWRAAVTFIALHMAEPFFADFSDGGSNVFFFDIAVKGIQCNFKVGVVNFFDNREGLISGINHIALETVQRLQTKDNSLLFCKLSSFRQVFHTPLSFLLFLFVGYKTGFRSEERRVGKEFRSCWWWD